MTTFVCLSRAAVMPMRQLLLMAVVAAVSMGLPSATASASTGASHGRGAYHLSAYHRLVYDHSLAVSSARSARLQPPHLEVVGHKLKWARVKGVHDYVFRRRQARHPKVLKVVATTSAPLVPVPDAIVRYSVRTDLPGSIWASPITIVYSESGGVLEIRGENPESGSEGGSESGSEGGSEGHSGGGSLSLKVGLDGLMGWGTEASEKIHQQTGVEYTRLEPAAEGWAIVQQAVSEGVKPYVLYNPGLQGMSPEAVAEGVKSFIPHMRELGLSEIELGNEVYYHGSTPAEYAAQYRAANEALAGTGITLIADAWIDTQKPNGEWSDWESGGGWCVLFVEALGYVPDAWSFHPYGPMNADGFGSGADRPGWATVPRMIAYMKADHVYAPLEITEVGQPTSQGSDGNTPVSEAEQAADVKQYLTQAAEWGLSSIYLFEAVNTAEGGYGLYDWPLQAKPSAGVFGETLAQLELNP